MFPSFLLALTVPFILATKTNAESHTIKFFNQCGFGSPALMFNGENILTGDTYTSNGPYSGIAYLQTGYCNVNGENCTLLETTLINPTCAGCGSSTDISLIPPHVYSVETSFAYYNGCDGIGQTCDSPSCPSAFFTSNDNSVQVECQADNVNLLVSFCASAAQFVPSSGVSSPSSSPGGPTSTIPVATSPATATSSSPTSTPTSSPSSASSTTPSSTNALTSSGGAASGTPRSTSSPSRSSVPTTSTPTTSTPTTPTTSTPGAMNVSPTSSGIGASYPTTSTTPRRCRPRTSSIPPTPTSTPGTPTPATTATATATATTDGSAPPNQCGASGLATHPGLRRRHARHAQVHLDH